MTEFVSASPRRTIRKIKINGQLLSAEVTDQITAGDITMATDSEPKLEFTVIDHPDMPLTAELAKLLAEGTTMEWESTVFALTRFSVEAGTEVPLITIEGTAEAVHKLDQERGGKNWNEIDVTNWAKEVIRNAGAIPQVQPDLGTRKIERKEDEDIPENGETTWDVLAEAAKKVGAWVYENGAHIVFGKPSWISNRPDSRQLAIEWNSWTDHTDGLTAVPGYEWDWANKPWEGRERLSLRVWEPPNDEELTNSLHHLRPGDRVLYTGKAAPSDDPTWVVTRVSRAIYTGGEVMVDCARPIDPPEIQDSSDAGPGGGEGEGTAGVPTGPIGAMGWNGEQLENAAEIVKEGQRRQLPEKAMVLAVQTAMAESSLINKDHGDEIYGVTNPDGSPTSSRGLFQQQALWGPLSVRMNPAKSAGLFYDRLKANNEYNSAVDGPTSSAVIHRVQGNQDPMHYARFWPDAQLVTRKCIEAGEAASKGGFEADGDLGKRIKELMNFLNGKPWDVDGAHGAQCYDLAQKYVTDLKGIGMIRADGIDFWKHPGLLNDFTPIPASRPPRKGDVVSWGINSDYANFIQGRYRGHVAIFSHNHKGLNYYLTQNPGAAHIAHLTPRGILGWMRPK